MSPQPPSERKCFKIANFSEQEALDFLKCCEECKSPNNTKVIIASDAPGEFPPHYRASAEETITTYRNGIKPGHGLIYIETKVESDSQGLKNLFTLRDINFLDGSFDDQEFRTAEHILITALSAFGGRYGANDLLTTRCLEVLDGLKSGGIAVSVRKFIAFALMVAEQRSEFPAAVDSTHINNIVGRALIALDLFPDEQWRSRSTSNLISRRLTQNLLHAELASSQTADLDQDRLVEQCRSTNFRDFEGNNLEKTEQDKWRELCSEYCVAPVSHTRNQIPYFIFEQLFTRDLKGLKLGERVFQEISENAPSRLGELENLSVKTGLDRRDQDDALRFLEKESEDSDVPALRDLLSKPTLRMVEKAAYPNPEQFQNPLTKLAEVAELFRKRLGNSEGKKIILRVGRNTDINTPSLGLFSFLFCSTLRSVSEASQFTAEGFTFELDDSLANVSPPPQVIDVNEGQEDTEELPIVSWDPVSVEFVVFDNKTGKELDSEQALQWFSPAINRLALFWLLVAAPDAPDSFKVLECPDNASADEWIGEIVSRTVPLDAYVSKTLPEAETLEHEIVAELTESTNDFRAQTASGGISIDLLTGVYDRWNVQIDAAKQTFIPEGSADPHLTTLLLHECILGPRQESMLMLPSHPLRTRWIAEYLRKSEELAVQALNGELPLNSQNAIL